jgi:hypothetical protein
VFAPSLLEMRYINFPSFFLLSQVHHTSQSHTPNLHSQPLQETIFHQSSFNHPARKHTTTMPPHQMTKSDASQIQSRQVTSLYFFFPLTHLEPQLTLPSKGKGRARYVFSRLRSPCSLRCRQKRKPQRWKQGSSGYVSGGGGANAVGNGGGRVGSK